MYTRVVQTAFTYAHHQLVYVSLRTFLRLLRKPFFECIVLILECIFPNAARLAREISLFWDGLRVLFTYARGERLF